MNFLPDTRKLAGTDSGFRIGRPLAVAACLLAAACADPPPVRTAAMEAGPVTPPPPTAAGVSATGSYLAGRFAQKRRDFGNAANYLDRALRSNPANPRLMRRTFAAMLADGRIDDAMRLAEGAAGQEANAPLIAVALLVGDLRAGRTVEAERRLAALPRRGLGGFAVPLLGAWTAVRQGRSAEEAGAALEPLRKMAGFAVLHDLHVGLIHDLTGDAAKAEAHYLRAAQATARPLPRAVEALGSFYERQGRPEQARKLYETERERDPRSPFGLAIDRLAAGRPAARIVSNGVEGAAEALFNLAGALADERSAEIALIYARLATVLRPAYPPTQMLVGRILETLDRPAEAIEVYARIRRDSPFWWSARLRRAASLEALGEDEKAIAELRDMSRERRNRPDALVDLGDVLRAKKRFAEAAAAYDAAVERIGRIDRRHWTLLYSRGIALERSKQWVRAEEDFLAALELRPDQPYILNYLGYSWVDRGVNLERARKMIERAVAQRPDDGYIVDSLGWVLYRLGHSRRAVEQLERAVELLPQDPTINDHLGDAYWTVGRRIEARFQWRRALSLDPEPEQIAAIREKMADGLSAAEASGPGGEGGTPSRDDSPRDDSPRDDSHRDEPPRDER